jgi:LuxR family maltose regulon positive regulatory protein
VLPTKVVAPAVPRGFIGRTRLDELVDGGTQGRVTLVSARAGAGKTVLLSAWAASDPSIDVAWLTLDRDDNWSPSFWLAVHCALDEAEAADGMTSPHSLHEPETTSASVSTRLSARQGPVALVLDNFQEIENKIVLRELDALLLHAPPQLRLVIATRADPSLRLQRLRLAGHVTEIRASDLAFTSDECRALLGRLAENLIDEDIEALRARTEGWAAGIRLAAMSLEQQRDPQQAIRKFAGDDRAVADYLMTEVLERQDAERREFLLRTSIPATLTAGLASELSGHPHGGRVLEQLELQNVLISTEAAGEWHYRYPGLLREFLQAQLAWTAPEQARLLYRRAARWHWRSGEALVAFREAISGEDWDLVETIYADAWPLLVLLPLATGTPGLPRVPLTAVTGRPALMLEAASATLGTLPIDFSSADGLLSEAEAALEHEQDSPAFESLRTHATLLRLIVARLTGDVDTLESAAADLLEASKHHTFVSTGPAQVLQAMALTNLGTASVMNGSLEEAEARLDEAVAFARDAGADLQQLNSLSQIALVETARGRLRRAAEVATEAMAFAERRGWSEFPQALGSQFALAWAHYQWNDLDVAQTHVERMDAAAVIDEGARLAADLLGALLVGAQGARGAERGLRLLYGSRAASDGNGRVPFYLRSTLELAKPRLLAARGDLPGARAALAAHDGRAAPDGFDVLLARLHLVDGDPEGALAALAHFRAGPGPEQLPLEIEAAVLRAVAHSELHDARASSAAFGHALELGGPNSYRRVFLDVGPSVRPLLESQIRRGTSHRSFAGELMAAFERRAPSVEITKPELLEPLSERERAVLRYLPTLMSNAEIASEMFVSVNTVKTHLRSIYRKLGATRRRDAVERARRLELL